MRVSHLVTFLGLGLAASLLTPGAMAGAHPDAAPAASPAGRSPACPTLDEDLPWHGDNRARLDAMIAEHGRCGDRRPGKAPVAVFDWDNTMVRNDVGDATMFWALRNDVIRQPEGASWMRTSPYLTPEADASLRTACGTQTPGGRPLPTSTDTECADEILAVYSDAETSSGDPAFAGFDHRRLEPSYAWLPQVLAGWTPREVRGFAAEARRENLGRPVGALQRVGSNMVTGWVRYFDQQRDLVATLDKAGFDVWIVSASPQPVVEVWARAVGVARNRVIGIRSEAERGTLSHDLTGCGGAAENTVITYIDGKRCWINQEIYRVDGARAFDLQPAHRRPVFGAGDSTTDLTFLRDSTTLRLVVNRNKTELMCHAYHNADGGWVINPMFIEPLPQAPAPYPCSTEGSVDDEGNPIPAVDDSGAVIPDQIDTVFVPEKE